MVKVEDVCLVMEFDVISIDVDPANEAPPDGCVIWWLAEVTLIC